MQGKISFWTVLWDTFLVEGCFENAYWKINLVGKF